MSKNGKKRKPLFGHTRTQVERIIECLEQGCSDEELTMRIRNVRVPFDTWKEEIPEEYIDRVLRARSRHGGRKIEVSASINR